MLRFSHGGFLRFLKSFVFLLLLGLLRIPPAAAQFPPAPGTGPGLPETIEAIDSARVTTRILYITAHPDDESAAVLTYLARGLHADVALLTLTRGEGGQNALGPEQAPQLGLIRTQELLAATRGYGVKLYFTRARDFGYSKTPEETEKIWGNQVLEDMVRVIRSFRPNIVINGWGGVHTGHGHHQVSGIWTPKAVALAGDPAYELNWDGSYPFSPADLAPCKTGLILDLDRSDSPKGYVLPLDDVSPLWGKSWRQIGLDAFVNHHTQGIAGFVNSPFLRRQIALIPENGATFDPAKLCEPITTLLPDNKLLADAQKSLRLAREAVLQGDFAAATHHLADAANDFNDPSVRYPYNVAFLPPHLMQHVEDTQRVHARVEKALAMAAGLQVKAAAATGLLLAGESFRVTANSTCRKEAGCSFGSLKLTLPRTMEQSAREGSADWGLSFTIAFTGKDPLLRPGDLPIRPNERLPEPPPLITADQE